MMDAVTEKRNRRTTRLGLLFVLMVLFVGFVSSCLEQNDPSFENTTSEQQSEPEVPQIRTPVNDNVGVLSIPDTELIAQKIVRHFAEQGVQIALLVVSSTEGESIEAFSLQTARTWKGGRASDSKGVLVTFALSDRRSRIEVGYGLESVLTNERSLAILERANPLLRERRYGEAFQQVIQEIIESTGGVALGSGANVAGNATARDDARWLGAMPKPKYVSTTAAPRRARHDATNGAVWIGLVCLGGFGLLIVWLIARNDARSQQAFENYDRLNRQFSPERYAIRHDSDALKPDYSLRTSSGGSRRVGGSRPLSSSMGSSSSSSSSARSTSWSGGGGGFGGGGASSSW